MIVTVIADNYYGYCKKEVKTQISYSAYLLGYSEEEHAGGALVYPEYDLGKYFTIPTHLPGTKHLFEDAVAASGDGIDLRPQRYVYDGKFSSIVYFPEDVAIDIYKQKAEWTYEGSKFAIDLAPEETYVVPLGFKIRLQQDKGSNGWRLIGTRAESTFCQSKYCVRWRQVRNFQAYLGPDHVQSVLRRRFPEGYGSC